MSPASASAARGTATATRPPSTPISSPSATSTTNGLTPRASDFPKAQKFNDFRKMFDKLGKEIDAVTISTPDHTHAVATMMAIKMGKHVYTQKPMTHDVYEARQLRLAAREHKIVSQMGNQGTATDGLREGVEADPRRAHRAGE